MASAALFFLFEKEKLERDRSEECRPNEKFEPYDHFMQVRSWPDRTFSPEAFFEKMAQAERFSTERSSPCESKTAWRQEGPGNIAGRCNVLKASPADPNLILAGFATGGIWRSTDGGTNWQAVAPNLFNCYAVSDFAFSPAAPNTVWAALGDANISINPSPNGGVLKSTDGGQTWLPLAPLPNTFVVNAKLAPHPTNPAELWLASMGSPFKKNAERGVFKSTNGGTSFSKKLFVSEQAGAIDLVMDPTDPKTMFAAGWDRIRSNTESTIGGPGTRIFRTKDGGETWQGLGGGLPTFTTSRPGLIMSPSNPKKLFAVFADSTAKFLGVWKTTDGGDNWTPINTAGLANAFVDFGWYFGKIRLDPANDERLYVLGLNIYKRSLPDNGFGADAAVHSDVHDMLFRPDGSRLVACDGGIYRVPAGSLTSTRVTNMATTQFYHVGWNPHKPDRYYGGAQDNGTMQGNAAIFNQWPSVFGGDGFRTAFHPTDAKTYYFETQNGAISATDDGAQTWNYGSSALGTADRTNWDTPFLMSPHNPNTLYAGTFRLYKNEAGPALDWQPISDDLTDGNIYGARFHTISCIDESKIEAGRLAVGTSDGNVWVKTPQGAWTNVTAGLPDRYVTQVRWSEVVKDRLFVSVSGYREGETEAKLFFSEPAGQGWSDIFFDAGLDMPVNDFIVLPGSADSAMVVATDFEVFRTINGVAEKLGSTDFKLPIFDLELDHANRRIVAGTWGRGIWTYPLDSVMSEFSTVLKKTSVVVKTPAGLPVAGVEIKDFTYPATPFSTGGDGTRLSSEKACADKKFRVSKTGGPLDGVSTFDLVAMSKHILNVAPFSQPWQFIATDINRNKQVTTFDIVELRKLILGIYSNFPQNTSWRFYPKDFVFTKPNSAEESLPDSLSQYLSPGADTAFFDFIGVKTGDANGDWLPFAPEASDRSPMEIFSEDRFFEKGEVFEAEFSASVAGLVAGQFTLGFDKNVLRAEAVEPLLAGMDDSFFGKNRLGDGLLTASFMLENPFGFSEKICRVRFRALKKGSLAATLHLDDWPTPSRGFSPEGIENQTFISFSKKETGGAAIGNWRLSQNPVGGGPVFLLNENIDWLPESRPVELTVFDAAGRVLFYEKSNRPGDGRLPFPTEKLPPASGLFFLKIDAGGQPQVLRFIKV